MKTATFHAGAVLAMLLIGRPTLRAHCDTMAGPVVLTAQAALAAKDVTPVLKWVKATNEPAIREAFTRTLAVRSASGDAAALADEYFFSTLVRLHRAGEREPFTGLKPGAPAGTEQAADHVLESGEIAPLASDLTTRIQQQIEQKFSTVRALRAHADHNVDAGRAYVAAYVEYVHFVAAVAQLGAQHPEHTAHAHKEP